MVLGIFGMIIRYMKGFNMEIWIFDKKSQTDPCTIS